MDWIRPAPGLRLQRGVIDVWRRTVEAGDGDLPLFHDTLSAEEVARAQRFRIREKYDEYVVTRGLLRQALSCVLGRPPGDFTFDYTDTEKPFLENGGGQTRVSFNVSHSGGMALVALCPGRDVGIDIEQIRRSVDYEPLARRFFSRPEYEALMDYPGDPVRAFFATWTRKEAFVKAVGKGIAFGLDAFDVNVDPDEPPVMLATRWDPAAAARWSLAAVDAAEGYMATVAAAGAFRLRSWE